MERDRVWQLRQRLFALVTWFREDANRLNDAQDARRFDQTWERRRELRVAELGNAGDAELPTGAPRALLELEAVDVAAAIAARRARPPQPVGAGAAASWIVRRAPRPLPRVSRQAGVLLAHVQHHSIVPQHVTVPGGATFRVKLVSLAGPGRCWDAMGRGHVEVGTTAFEDGARLDLHADRSARSVATADARLDALAAALDTAARAGVDILVAPELTIPPPQRDRLIETLGAKTPGSARVAFAVLGSFHEACSVGRDVRMFNVAALVDGRGNRLIEHRKLVRFGDHCNDLSPEAADERGSLPESIQTGNAIQMLATPFGIVAVAICKDFCDVNVGSIWQQIQPDWLLVPAYGPGETAHRTAAVRLALAAGTVTVLAHEAKHSVRTSGEGSFVHDRERLSSHALAPMYMTYKIGLISDDADLDGGRPRN